jgi:hypothetical protein
MQISDDVKEFIKTKPYKEIEASLLYSAENLIRLGAKDESLPFTEGLMKEYALKMAKEYFKTALNNLNNLANKKDIEKISWK